MSSVSSKTNPFPRLGALGFAALILLGVPFLGIGAVRAAPEDCLQQPDPACLLTLSLEEQSQPRAVLVETLAVAGLMDKARRLAQDVKGGSEIIVDIVELARSGEAQRALRLAADKKADLDVDVNVLVVSALAWSGRGDDALSIAKATRDAASRSAAMWHIAYALAAAGQDDLVGSTVNEAVASDALRDLNVLPLLLDLGRRGAVDQVRAISEAMPDRPDALFIHTIRRALANLVARDQIATVEAILLTHGHSASANWRRHFGAMLRLQAETYAQMQRSDAVKTLRAALEDAVPQEQYLPLLVRAGDADSAIEAALQAAATPYRTLMLVDMATEAYAAGNADALRKLREIIGSDDPDPSDLLAFSAGLRLAGGTGRVEEALKLLKSATAQNRTMLLAFDLIEAVARGGNAEELVTLLEHIERNGGLAEELESAFHAVCDAIETQALRLNFEHSQKLAAALLRAAEAGRSADAGNGDHRIYGRDYIMLGCQYNGGDTQGAARTAMAAPAGKERADTLFLLARALLGY